MFKYYGGGEGGRQIDSIVHFQPFPIFPNCLHMTDVVFEQSLFSSDMDILSVLQIFSIH